MNKTSSAMVDAFTKAVNTSLSGAAIEKKDDNKIKLKAPDIVIRENNVQ